MTRVTRQNATKAFTFFTYRQRRSLDGAKVSAAATNSESIGRKSTTPAGEHAKLQRSTDRELMRESRHKTVATYIGIIVVGLVLLGDHLSYTVRTSDTNKEVSGFPTANSLFHKTLKLSNRIVLSVGAIGAYIYACTDYLFYQYCIFPLSVLLIHSFK